MILKPTTIYVDLNGDVEQQSRTSIYRYSDINEIRLVSPLAVEGGMRVNFLLSNGVTIEQKVMTALTETETYDDEEWNVWSYRPTNVITATLTAQSVTTLQLSFTQITVVEGRTFGNTFGTATLSVNPTIEGPEPTLEDATALDDLQTDITNLTTALGTKVDEDLDYSVLTITDEDESYVYVYYNGGSYKVSLQQWIELVNEQFTTFSTRLAFLEGAVPQPVGVGTQPSFNKVTVNELTLLKNGDTATIDYDDALAINTTAGHIDNADIHFAKSDVSKDDVGLDKVDNTTDLAKPISTLTQTALNGKQATLVSGTNIKTLNNTSLLGEGDLDISTLLPNALEFKGTFGSEQSTTGGDLPTTENSVGDIYIADTNNFASAVAGVTFQSGDKALFDGTTFLRNAANDSVTSVNNRVGPVTLSAADVGLDNLANTAQVTSVTGTSPIVATAGTTPEISILAATDAVAGSMSAADKLKLDSLTAETVLFDEVTFTGQLLTEPATENVQDALVLLDTHTHGVADLTDLSATTVTYNNDGQNLVSTTVQGAISEIDGLVEEGLTQVVVVKYTITAADDGTGGFTYNRNQDTGLTGTIDGGKFVFDLPTGVEYVTEGNRLVIKIDGSDGSIKRLFYGADEELSEPSNTTFAVEFALVDNDVLYSKLFQSLATVSTDIGEGSVTQNNLADGAVITTKIANNNVTLAKVEQIPTNTILGNDTVGTANVKTLTVAETKTLLELDQVQNTLDVNKPISNDTATALNLKVTGPESAVAEQVATFNGTTGKLIKDSGFTIETSVPSGALFTDTVEDNVIEIVQAESTPLVITNKAVNVTRASLGLNTLNGIDDISIDNPLDGEFLKYNGANWHNSTLPSPNNIIGDLTLNNQSETNSSILSVISTGLNVNTNINIENDLVVAGNLTVQGTETILNTETLNIEDKNIVLGNVESPSDTTANDGGITLKGTTDKIINYEFTTNRWNSNIEFNAPTVTAATINATTGLTINSEEVVSKKTFTGTLTVGGWSGDGGVAPFTQTVTTTGMLETDNPFVDINFSNIAFANVETTLENWPYVYRGNPGNNTVEFFATEIPDIDIPVKIRR